MSNNLKPLPEKLRPSSIGGVIGHDSLFSSEGKLTRIIKNIPLCILSFFMKKIGVNIDNNNIFFSVK